MQKCMKVSLTMVSHLITPDVYLFQKHVRIRNNCFVGIKQVTQKSILSILSIIQLWTNSDLSSGTNSDICVKALEKLDRSWNSFSLRQCSKLSWVGIHALHCYLTERSRLCFHLCLTGCCIVAYIRSCQDPKAYAGLLFVEFNSVFNTLQLHLLIPKLKQMSVNPFIIKLYFSFVNIKFKERSFSLFHWNREFCALGWCQPSHFKWEKTKEMVLDTISVGDHSPLVMHDEPINRVCSYKYFGIHLDNPFCWNAHVESLCSR